MGNCCAAGANTARAGANFLTESLSQSIPPQGDGPMRLGREILEAHNVYRSRHAAPPLQWSSEAAQAAERWAKRLARIGKTVAQRGVYVFIKSGRTIRT